MTPNPPVIHHFSSGWSVFEIITDECQGHHLISVHRRPHRTNFGQMRDGQNSPTDVMEYIYIEVFLLLLENGKSL